MWLIGFCYFGRKHERWLLGCCYFGRKHERWLTGFCYFGRKHERWLLGFCCRKSPLGSGLSTFRKDDSDDDDEADVALTASTSRIDLKELALAHNRGDGGLGGLPVVDDDSDDGNETKTPSALPPYKTGQ